MTTKARITFEGDDKTKGAVDSVKKGLDGIQSRAQAVGAIMGTTFGVAVSGTLLASAAAIRSGIDELERMEKASQKVGISAQKLAEYGYNASLAGASTELLEKGVANLSKKMSENDKIFAAMGITVKTATGELKSTDRVLDELADKFAGYADGPEKVALAQELMGKSGRDLIPMLNQGAEGMRKMAEEARALGLIFGPDQMRQAAEYKDNIDRLRTAAEGVGIAMAERMLPGLIQVTGQMVEGAKQGGVLLGIWRGLAEFGSIAFGTDALGKALAKTSQLNAEMSRIGDQISDQAAVLNRDPDNAMAQRRINSLRKKLAELQKDALTASETVKMALDPTYGSDPSFDALEQRRLGKGKGKSAAPQIAGGDALKARNKELAEQAKLLAEIAGLSGSFADDWDRLTKIYTTGKISTDQLAAAQAELLAKQPFFQKEQRATEEATKSLLAVWDLEGKALAKVAEEYEKLIDEQDKSMLAMAGEVQAQREYNQRIGLTVDAIAALEAAKLEEQATAKDRLATLADEIDWTGALGDAYRAQAKSLRELAQLKADGAVSQKQIDDFKSVWESVDKTAHDTFTNIFEGGSNAFKKLRDTLKATLLDLLYQMTVRKWVFNIAASVTGSSAGAVSSVGGAAGLLGGGGGGLLGTIQGGADILNTGGIAGFGYGIGNTAGTALANLTGTGIDGLLATNGAFGTAGGAMGALGTALPYIGAALAVISLLDSGKRGGPKDIGSYGSGFLGADYTRADSGEQFNSGAANIVGGIGSSYAAMTKALGIKAGDLQSGAMFAIDNKGEGDALTALTTQSYLNGKLVYDRNDAQSGSDAYKDVGRSPEELQAAITLASARAVLSALKASDLPVKLADYFDSLDPLAMSAEQITAALDLAKAAQTFTYQLGFMGNGLTNLAGLSVKATADLAAAAGGMDQLQSKFAAYYQAFYSEEERAAASLASVTDAMANLGYANVDTAAEFRDLVESIDPVDDASRALLASLLDLSPAFAAVHSSVSSFLTGLNAAASSYFAGLDGQNMATSLSGEAAAGIDKFIGATVGTLADAQATQAQAALSAAREAATLWGQAQSSIEAALAGVRGGTFDMLAPGQRRTSALGAFDKAAIAALAGDAPSAAAIGDLAQQFLTASASSTTDRISYLRDRALAEAKLASVLDKTKAQVTLQEAIASASEATVAQLQIVNQTLTGFSATVFEMLSKGYVGADRQTATDAAEKLAKATSDFAYWFNTTKEGDTVTGGQWGGSKWTRLAGDMASFTNESGLTTYLRSADTILDAAKRDPGLRAIWEQQYGIKLPAFAGGGSHAGGWATVGEAGAERVFLPPARIFSANDTLGMASAEAATVHELRGLRADLAQERSASVRMAIDVMIRAEAISARLKKWDTIGMPPARAGASA